MARNILINRDEAELLTDLLMESERHNAYELDVLIRKTFGMCSQEKERELKENTQVKHSNNG